jgi:molecular chaperone DnaJ
VLRDAEKRAAYDRYGHAGVKGRGAGGGGQQYGGFGFEDALNIFMRDFGGFGGLEDLFGGGAGRGRGGAQRGKDLQIKLSVSLAEVASGVKKTVKIRALDACSKCSGAGSEDPSGPATCPGCQGAGQVRRVQRSVFGQFVSASVCPQCQGAGQIIKNPCKKCGGDGRERGEQTLEIQIPAGVSTNNYLTLRGQGNAGPRNGPRGDVIAVIEVEDDPRFEREDTDLVFDLRLSFSAAALGQEVDVPTVYGDERVRIPAGTQSGDVLTLRGKGLPQLGGGPKGDQHVRVHVWTPTELSAEQEELFRRLAELEGPAPDGEKPSGLWRWVKDAFAA